MKAQRLEIVSLMFACACLAIACSSTTDPASSTGKEGASGGGLPGIIMPYNFVSDWKSRDLSGLPVGSVSADFEVYLPKGASWDASLRSMFASQVRAGGPAGGVEAKLSFSEVKGNPTAQRVAVSQAAPSPGVYWFALTGEHVRPFMASPYFNFAVAPPKYLLPRFVVPGLVVRTVGSCPHPVEVALDVASDVKGNMRWKVRFSEKMQLASDKTKFTLTSSVGESSKANSVSASIAQTDDRTLEIVANAEDIKAKSAHFALLDEVVGVAGAFATSLSCDAQPYSISLPTAKPAGGLESQFMPALPYSALAKRLAPDIFGAASK